MLDKQYFCIKGRRTTGHSYSFSFEKAELSPKCRDCKGWDVIFPDKEAGEKFYFPLQLIAHTEYLLLKIASVYNDGNVRPRRNELKIVSD